MLKAGFARLDITPPLGKNLSGYYEPRIADGVLDPLLVSATVFDDGERRGVLISADIIGMSERYIDSISTDIAKAIGTDVAGVYICATHTHVGPHLMGITTIDDGLTIEQILEDETAAWIKRRIVDAAVIAASDLSPATILYTKGEARDVAFIRRFRMKDGSAATNPGW